MDAGPYRVSQAYKYLVISPAQWTKLGKIAREKHLKQISSARLKPVSATHGNMTSKDISISSVCNFANTDSNPSQLSVSISLEESGLPSQIFKDIWSKAQELVSKEDMIVNAPGAENVKICASYSSSKPHIVTVFESGKITCDCKKNENLTLCSHSIAVAEKGGYLHKLLKWYMKSKQSANLWCLSKTSNVPKRPGAKPNQRQPRKIRSKVPVLTCSTDEDSTLLQPPSASVPSCSTSVVSNLTATLSTPNPSSHVNTQWGGAYSYGACSTQFPMSRPSVFPPHMSFSPYYYHDPYYSTHHGSRVQHTPEIQHNSNPFLATIRSGNVSKCASCSGTFPRHEQVVVLKHIEKSLYIKDGETRVSKERPHYYHALLQCILYKHPYFTRQMLQVESDLYDSLTQSNKELLDNL